MRIARECRTLTYGMVGMAAALMLASTSPSAQAPLGPDEINSIVDEILGGNQQNVGDPHVENPQEGEVDDAHSFYAGNPQEGEVDDAHNPYAHNPYVENPQEGEVDDAHSFYAGNPQEGEVDDAHNPYAHNPCMTFWDAAPAEEYCPNANFMFLEPESCKLVATCSATTSVLTKDGHWPNERTTWTVSPDFETTNFNDLYNAQLCFVPDRATQTYDLAVRVLCRDEEISPRVYTGYIDALPYIEPL